MKKAKTWVKDQSVPIIRLEHVDFPEGLVADVADLDWLESLLDNTIVDWEGITYGQTKFKNKMTNDVAKAWFDMEYYVTNYFEDREHRNTLYDFFAVLEIVCTGIEPLTNTIPWHEENEGEEEEEEDVDLDQIVANRDVEEIRIRQEKILDKVMKLLKKPEVFGMPGFKGDIVMSRTNLDTLEEIQNVSRICTAWFLLMYV